MLASYGTIAVRPDDCFDYWHHFTCRTYSFTECRLHSDRQFSAQISIRKFGALAFSHATSRFSDLIELTRTPHNVLSDARDDFMLFLPLQDDVVLAQDGREARASGGDLVLYDQARPFRLQVRHQDTMLVSIPRPLLMSRTSKAPEMTARRIGGRSRLGALTGSVMHRLAQLEDSLDEKVLERLAASALDILATALEAEFCGAERAEPRQQRKLDQVKRYVLANLHDTSLDLRTIASAQNLAPRTLNRLFAAEGTTPIRWLWRQRLNASYRALAEGHVTQVTDAALNFGFTDLSHFSRAFKEAFGTLPHALRQRSTATARGPKHATRRKPCA